MSQHTDYKHGYYVYLSNRLSCKNNLQKQILEALERLDGMLLTRENYAELDNLIAIEIKHLNQINNRCKPEKYIVQKIDDWYIYNFDFVKVNLYKVNKVLELPF